MVSAITYLRREEIDTAKWDRCIDTASNGLIYPYSFYLDHMSRHWDALVWSDYEAVMPLTWNKKWGISYLYQPAFTASLGLFGKQLTGEMLEQMMNLIPKKFRLVEIELNHGNIFDEQFPQRVNYILDLNKPYESIANGYNENLQRNLKKAQSRQLKYVTGVPVQDVIQLAKQHVSQLSGYKEQDYINFYKLFSLLHASGQAVTFGVYNGTELAASAVFFFSHNRAYYILVGNRADKRTEGASHFLIDRFIHDHSGKPLLLDFEGSDIEGLANFYASYGAAVEKYASLRIDRLPWYVRLLKL